MDGKKRVGMKGERDDGGVWKSVENGRLMEE